MLKAILVFFAVLIVGMIYFQQSLQDGSVLRYIDQHAQEKRIPEATYYVGEGYYLFQNLLDATTYFLRVAQRYPNHPLAEDAYFNYLQCLDEMSSVTRAEMAQGYGAYLEKYPDGKHSELARTRYANYTTGAR
jgi:TolA-binding protein